MKTEENHEDTEITHKPFVVFCTAYDQYISQAFDSLSIDYIIKPVEVDHLLRIISKIEKIAEQISVYSLQTVIDAIVKVESRKSPTSIPHKVGDKTILVKLEKVVYFKAEDKYVNFYNLDGKRFISDQSLKSLEDKLPESFIRVSKSVILNKDYVIEFHKYFRGRVVFIMEDIKKTRIISGGSYAESIRCCFEF